MYSGKGPFMSQEQQNAADYVCVTFAIHEPSEDDECCIVSDKYGHDAELSTNTFLHDAEDIDVGDTIVCGILREAWGGTGFTPGDAGPRDVHICGWENIEVLVDLTDEQLLELGSEITDALCERDKLRTELLTVKKGYKARVDLSVSKAAEAAAEYRSSKRFETVSCDRFKDRTTMEVVWCDSVTGKEVSRHPMTAGKRQHRPELVTPDKPVNNDEGRAKVLTLPTPPTASTRTCLSCRHLSADDTGKVEPCMACTQANGDDADSWESRRRCKTRARVTSTVDGSPCGGYSLNPDPGHDSDEGRWTWKDTPKEGIPCQPDT